MSGHHSGAAHSGQAWIGYCRRLPAWVRRLTCTPGRAGCFTVESKGGAVGVAAIVADHQDKASEVPLRDDRRTAAEREFLLCAPRPYRRLIGQRILDWRLAGFVTGKRIQDEPKGLHPRFIAYRFDEAGSHADQFWKEQSGLGKSAFSPRWRRPEVGDGHRYDAPCGRYLDLSGHYRATFLLVKRIDRNAELIGRLTARAEQRARQLWPDPPREREKPPRLTTASPPPNASSCSTRS